MDSPFKKFRVPKWPFVLAQLLLLGFAYFIVWRSPHPIAKWEIIACFAAAAAGALVGVWPFILDYRAMGKVIDAGALGEVSGKIQDLQTIATRISNATNEWANVQVHAEKTANSANEIANRMTDEVRQFSEFMQKMNDSEKAMLRLESEKLHRNEGEWLQTLVRIMDHVFALYSAAARSGQPQLASQIENFQNACRGTARRMGLTPLTASPGEPFQAERHQTVDDVHPPGAVVAETVATGYSYQGKLIRPVLVKVNAENPEAETSEPDAPAAEQPADDLSLQPPD